MAQPAHSVVVKATAPAVALSNEAMSLLSGDTFVVTNAAKRILDPGAAIVIHDDGSPVAAGDFAVDYLAGTVTFAAPPATPVTINSGAYLPAHAVAGAREFSISMERVELEDTEFGDTLKSRFVGLKFASGSLSGFFLADDDWDPGGGTLTADGAFGAGTQLVLEVLLDSATNHYFRGFVTLLGLDGAGAVDGVFTSTIGWSSVNLEATGRSERASFTVVTYGA
jgi:hypothetical protein